MYEMEWMRWNGWGKWYKVKRILLNELCELSKTKCAIWNEIGKWIIGNESDE
jgi:hypothetical protein